MGVVIFNTLGAPLKAGFAGARYAGLDLDIHSNLCLLIAVVMCVSSIPGPVVVTIEKMYQMRSPTM